MSSTTVPTPAIRDARRLARRTSLLVGLGIVLELLAIVRRVSPLAWLVFFLCGYLVFLLVDPYVWWLVGAAGFGVAWTLARGFVGGWRDGLSRRRIASASQ